jgi:two-component system LytT family response regulator
MNVLIIDDEHGGRSSLKILLQVNCNEIIKSIDIASNIELAKKKLESKKYQIVFLDIQLNTGLGFELVEFIDDKTNIIYVTAFSNYAILAIKNKAFDYLLKPIEPDELQKCVQKTYIQFKNRKKQYLNIKNNGVTIPMEQNEIVYIKANGPYSKILLSNNSIFICSHTLKSLTQKLNNDFIRVHKSFIVNANFIKGHNQKEVLVNDKIKLKVSRAGLCELQKYYTC